LLAAKTTGVVVVELVQFVVIIALALALGWSSGTGWPGAIGAVLLGTIAFAGIGLTMAGTLRGEVNLAAANGLYLVLLLLGGMVIPINELPTGLQVVARALPSGALSDALHGSLTSGGVPARAWIVLALWAVVAPTVAALTFRWE
jgi:ABC-2 type transport system permease protein